MSNYKLYQGDCLEVMKNIEDGSIDLVVTDPPYEISTTGAGIYKQEDKQYVKELNGMKDGFSEEVLDELCRVMKKINIYFFYRCFLEYSTKLYPAFHEHRKEVKRILEEEYGFKVEYHRVKEYYNGCDYQYNVFNISW